MITKLTNRITLTAPNGVVVGNFSDKRRKLADGVYKEYNGAVKVMHYNAKGAARELSGLPSYWLNWMVTNHNAAALA